MCLGYLLDFFKCQIKLGQTLVLVLRENGLLKYLRSIVLLSSVTSLIAEVVSILHFYLNSKAIWEWDSITR